jgi:hypothetical protein
LLVIVLELVGVDVRGWFSNLWDAVTAGSVGYQLVGFSGADPPDHAPRWPGTSFCKPASQVPGVEYKEVLAPYATGVAMNSFLPANIGPAVMLLMYVAITPWASLPGLTEAAAVQKIFFALASAFVYLYLQQFSITAWNIAFAVVAVVCVWVGGGPTRWSSAHTPTRRAQAKRRGESA